MDTLLLALVLLAASWVAWSMLQPKLRQQKKRHELCELCNQHRATIVMHGFHICKKCSNDPQRRLG